MQKYLNYLAFIFLCYIIFLGTKFYYSRQVKTVEVVREVERIIAKEVEISGEAMRYHMANIGKLCTAEYSYTHIERVDSSRELYGYEIPFTTATFIYSYDGTILAGIDFSKILINKNDITKRITVTLPDVEIISSDVDQNSFKLYDEKNNIFNPIRVTDVADSFANLKNTEEQKALDNGLLDRAEENAVLLVKNFMLSSYDIRDYTIEVVFDAAQSQ